MDILYSPAKPTGYYVADGDFSLPELKLLVDSVQVSQFVTEKKTSELIEKLEQLCSRHEARKLHRQVYVQGRIKNMNESIYYSVDAMHNAIALNKRISFKYFEYTAEKKRHYRHDGKRYDISPFALVLDNDD